jgi:23S rRNA (guanosine2251-2'-O)-methyltransferase
MSGARYIYGKNSVKALLETNPANVFKIFMAEGLKPDKRLQAIHEKVRERGIPLQMVPRTRLDQILKDQLHNAQLRTQGEAGGGEGAEEEFIVHQGVVASVAPKALLDLPSLIKLCQDKIAAGQHPRVLLLDSVTDARNFGAILRVADAAGIDGIIVPKHHSAGFGPGVTKTASGAEEVVNVAVVANLNHAIRSLKDAGFWIAGAAHEEKAVVYHQQDYQMPVALVMGSEDKGIAPLIRNNCDFLVSIPMAGTVESLNVATATAVLLFEITKPPRASKKKKSELPEEEG